MARQQKYTTMICDYDGVSGISIFESKTLPNPQKCVNTLESGYETIWGFEVLVPFIKTASNDFKAEL